MTDHAIALIGFGEVGTIFGRGLAASGRVRVAAYDIKFDDEAARGAILARAAEAGVAAAPDAAAAVAGAGLVISAVTAAVAEDVAAGLAPLLASGTILFDVNSASPATKARAAAHVAAEMGDYVEGAIMAPVAAPGIAVPILAGGARAGEVAELLNGLGFAVTAVSDRIGRASATKLCRSIVIKGLEALMLDCAAAARLHGVADDVFASLGRTFPSIDFAALADTMAERVARHGVRRAAEMREAADMLAEAGLDPALSLAVADAQARGAKP